MGILTNIKKSLADTFNYLTLTPSCKEKRWCYFIGEQGRKIWKEVDEEAKGKAPLNISHSIDRQGNKIIHSGHYGC